MILIFLSIFFCSKENFVTAQNNPKLASNSLDSQWIAFKIQYNKSYLFSSTEELRRFDLKFKLKKIIFFCFK